MQLPHMSQYRKTLDLPCDKKTASITKLTETHLGEISWTRKSYLGVVNGFFPEEIYAT